MTTNPTLQDAIKEDLLMLPKESQAVVNSFDWLGETEKIGKENNLNEDEINNLQIETALVLVGLTSPDLYPYNIDEKVGTTLEKSKKIADEALEKVFKPIADKIEQNIKNKVQDKNGKWDQNVNFALSGGDYSVFAEKAGTTNALINKTEPLPNPLLNKERAKGEVNPIEDIRSKFTI